MSFFIWLEGTAISLWVRESPTIWGFPFILFLHTLGLALVAGLSSAIALLAVTHAVRLQYARLSGVFRLIWVGFAINALSGFLLLLAYPAKALTNPVFYIKLVAIGGALAIVARQQTQLAAAPGTRSPLSGSAAIALLLLWATAILTGRLLAYTHSILMASTRNFY